MKPLTRRSALLAFAPPMIVLGTLGGNLPPLVYRIMVAVGLVIMLFEIHSLREDQEKMRALVEGSNPGASSGVQSDKLG